MHKTKYIRVPDTILEPFMRWHKIAEKNTNAGLSWSACGLKFQNEHTEQAFDRESAVGLFCKTAICSKE